MASIKHRFLLEGCPLHVLGTILPSRKPEYLFSLQIGRLEAAKFLEADHDKIGSFEVEMALPTPSNIVYLRHWYIPGVIKQVMLHEGLQDIPRFHDEWTKEYNRRLDILMDTQEQVIAELDTLKTGVWAGEIKEDDIPKHIQQIFINRQAALDHHGMSYVLNMNEHGKIKPNKAAKRATKSEKRKKQVPHRRFGTVQFIPEPERHSTTDWDIAQALISMSRSRVPTECKDDTEEESQSEANTPSTKRKRDIQDVDSNEDVTAVSLQSSENGSETRSRKRRAVTEEKVVTDIEVSDKTDRSSIESSASEYDININEPAPFSLPRKTKTAIKTGNLKSRIKIQHPRHNLRIMIPDAASFTLRAEDNTQNEDDKNPSEHSPPNRTMSLSPLFHPRKIISTKLAAHLATAFPFLKEITNSKQRDEWYHFLSFFSCNSPMFQKGLNSWFERNGKGGIRRNGDLLKAIEKVAGRIKVVGGGVGGGVDGVERVYGWAD